MTDLSSQQLTPLKSLLRSGTVRMDGPKPSTVGPALSGVKIIEDLLRAMEERRIGPRLVEQDGGVLAEKPSIKI